ncbi:hypothetical protein F210042A8_40680 [Blautia parvula]
MENKKIKKILPEILFLAAVFVFLLCWAVIQPLNASPDEGMRYQIVEYIMKHGSLPHGGDPEIRNEFWGISYAFNPILPYILGAVLGKAASLFSAAEMAPVIAARLVNVIFGTATAFLTHKIGKRMFKTEAAGFFTVLVCFLPGAIFIHSYINTDSVAVFSTSWIILCWIKAMDKGWTKGVCIELGAALSVCALSYYNAYGYILCSVFFFCGSILFCEGKRWNYKKMFSLGILITCVIIICAGWWFIRNGILYHGDILGMSTSSEYAELYAREDLKPSNRMTPQRMGMRVTDMFFWIPGEWECNWLTTVAVSFVGAFGFLDIFMPKIWSAAYCLVYAAGILGMFFCIRKQFFVSGKEKEVRRRKDKSATTLFITIRKERRWDIKNLFHICMLIAMGIPFILLIKYAYSSEFQAQGRYLMPMLISFMYFITLGYENIMDKFVKKAVYRKWIYRVLSVGYIISAVAVYCLVFAPNYR